MGPYYHYGKEKGGDGEDHIDSELVHASYQERR